MALAKMDASRTKILIKERKSSPAQMPKSSGHPNFSNTILCNRYLYVI